MQENEDNNSESDESEKNDTPIQNLKSITQFYKIESIIAQGMKKSGRVSKSNAQHSATQLCHFLMKKLN